MGDYGEYNPPTGPPPTRAPKVPEGWTARWNDQYNEWFFVNTYTKKSQWEKPKAAVYPPDGSPGGTPPDYGQEKKKKSRPSEETDSDQKLAAMLQAQENKLGNAQNRQSFYSSQNLPPEARAQRRESLKGGASLLGKMLNKPLGAPSQTPVGMAKHQAATERREKRRSYGGGFEQGFHLPGYDDPNRQDTTYSKPGAGYRGSAIYGPATSLAEKQAKRKSRKPGTLAPEDAYAGGYNGDGGDF